jgi:hypothetical protein
MSAERILEVKQTKTHVFPKQIIALGVLAMPTVLSATGGVPGSLIILVVGLLTTYSGHGEGFLAPAAGEDVANGVHRVHFRVITLELTL